VLRIIEAAGPVRDLTLDNPPSAIREVSHAMTGYSRIRLANGRELSALEIQYEHLTRASIITSRNGTDAADERILEMWNRTLGAI